MFMFSFSFSPSRMSTETRASVIGPHFVSFGYENPIYRSYLFKRFEVADGVIESDTDLTRIRMQK